MNRTQIPFSGKIREAIFWVGDQNDLHVELTLTKGSRHLPYLSGICRRSALLLGQKQPSRTLPVGKAGGSF